MDSDGDGTISLQEIQAAHEKIFKAMDTDKDGTVTLEKIQAFMRGALNRQTNTKTIATREATSTSFAPENYDPASSGNRPLFERRGRQQPRTCQRQKCPPIRWSR
jgi:EF-hand domain/EF hand